MLQNPKHPASLLPKVADIMSVGVVSYMRCPKGLKPLLCAQQSHSLALSVSFFGLHDCRGNIETVADG